MRGVYANRQRRCALVVGEARGVVHYISLFEEAGEMLVDLRKQVIEDFENEYKLIKDYPARRAAEHYLNPLTSAITITDKAKKALGDIMSDKELQMEQAAAEAAPAPTNLTASVGLPVSDAAKASKGKKTLSEKNIEATHKAGIKNTGSAPEVAPVKVEGKVPKKSQKGTWDKKETATESNEAAIRKAIKNRKEEQAKAEKKAARAASKPSKPSKPSNTTTTTDSQENTVNEKTETAKKTAAKTAAKAAAKTAKAPAKKAAASKPAKAAPAAKKLAKGTGKATAAKPAGKPAKAASKPAKEKTEGTRRRLSDVYPENAKIKVLVDENPRRGSKAKVFDKFKTGMTVGEFLKASKSIGGSLYSIDTAVQNEWISVK